jgi:hypothetical protein
MTDVSIWCFICDVLVNYQFRNHARKCYDFKLCLFKIHGILS